MYNSRMKSLLKENVKMLRELQAHRTQQQQPAQTSGKSKTNGEAAQALS